MPEDGGRSSQGREKGQGEGKRRGLGGKTNLLAESKSVEVVGQLSLECMEWRPSWGIAGAGGGAEEKERMCCRRTSSSFAHVLFLLRPVGVIDGHMSTSTCHRGTVSGKDGGKEGAMAGGKEEGGLE